MLAELLIEWDPNFTSLDTGVPPTDPNYFPCLMSKVSAACDEFKAEGNDPLGFKVPGGESGQDLEQRARQLIDRALKEHPGETVLIGGHNFINSKILGLILSSGWPKKTGLCNASISVVIFQNTKSGGHDSLKYLIQLSISPLQFDCNDIIRISRSY